METDKKINLQNIPETSTLFLFSTFFGLLLLLFMGVVAFLPSQDFRWYVRAFTLFNLVTMTINFHAIIKNINLPIKTHPTITWIPFLLPRLHLHDNHILLFRRRDNHPRRFPSNLRRLLKQGFNGPHIFWRFHGQLVKPRFYGDAIIFTHPCFHGDDVGFIFC